MIMKRGIIIVPEFKNGHLIDEIREKYDPLFNYIQPHITIVFPFESNIDNDVLKEHVLRRIKTCKQFEISLKGIFPIYEGKYLFLKIEKGKDNLTEIHKCLYKDILKEYLPDWLKDNDFYPHMTVGRIEQMDQFEKAIENTKDFNHLFECTIEKIYIDMIVEKDHNLIELNMNS